MTGLREIPCDSSSEISVKWDQSEDADEYLVTCKRKGIGIESHEESREYLTKKEQYKITKLIPDTFYDISVKGKNIKGKGTESNVFSIKTSK